MLDICVAVNAGSGLQAGASLDEQWLMAVTCDADKHEGKKNYY